MNRGLRAEEAGSYLAAALGLSEPIPKETMWRLARTSVVPTVRLGRLVYFLTDALDDFVRSGGSWPRSEPEQPP